VEIVRRQKERAGALISALRPENVEERYWVVRGVCTRLPLPVRAKHRVWSWGLNHVVGSKRSAFFADIRPAREAWDEQASTRLRQLLQGDESLSCPAVKKPTVSFILILHNKAHLSLLSLDSVIANAGVSYEVIVVDNASTDETRLMLERLRGAKVISNETNVGFSPACMQAAGCAEGEYLCFLNNDALLSANAISAALANFLNASVGAVGGKVLLANGALQEAGSIVWSDGNVLGYGRGDDPNAPQYNFRRPVDYCSGVFLVTPRTLFGEAGGFSSEFAPAYYEDADYCMTLWQRGFQVIYEPLAVIRHYESATSGGTEFAMVMAKHNRKKFFQKWGPVLKRHYAPDSSQISAARIAVGAPGLRILYIDDRIPHRNLGSGYPRSNDILRQLVRFGHHVTCSTFTFPLLPDEYSDLPREIELFDGLHNHATLVRNYFRDSDLIWVSRPHNMHLLLTQCMPGAIARDFRLIYDAEAIFSERAQQQRALGVSFSDAVESYDEFALARLADAVVVVSEHDRTAMLRSGLGSVHVLGHRFSPAPTSTSAKQRCTFLFIGAVHGPNSPNADSIRYFCRSVWPAVQMATGATLVVAGYRTDEVLGDLGGSTVQVLGAQESLRPLYEAARAFVVPTRYAAGLPFKVHEAAAFGVPLVVSDVIARQLRWRDGIDCLVAHDADTFAQQCQRLYVDDELWETLRRNALQRVIDELSPGKFEESLRSVLNDVTRGHALGGYGCVQSRA
jgi:O-antigen biosynthesis protein